MTWLVSRAATAARVSFQPPCHLPPAISTRYIPRRTMAVTRRPRNEAIPFPVVSLVDPETNALQPPTPLKTILASIQDPKSYHVELVADTPHPIVRIVDTKEALLKYKEQKKHSRTVARAQEHKEIQMTWGVGSGDLAHKVNKVRQELQKGRRVDLIFAPKKGQPVPTKQGMEIRLSQTLEALADIGKEYLPRDERKHIIALHLKPIV